MSDDLVLLPLEGTEKYIVYSTQIQENRIKQADTIVIKDGWKDFEISKVWDI